MTGAGEPHKPFVPGEGRPLQSEPQPQTTTSSVETFEANATASTVAPFEAATIASSVEAFKSLDDFEAAAVSLDRVEQPAQEED